MRRAKEPLLPTPAEARLLRALWKLGEATVEQIVHLFPEGERPNYKTTQTLLRIMEAKELVSHVARGKVFVFSPRLDEQTVAQRSVCMLLRDSFGGSASGLLINLLQSGGLRSSDLREMEALIQRFRQERESEEGAS